MGPDGYCYLGIESYKSSVTQGEGKDENTTELIVLGQNWLSNFYLQFDFEDNKINFAVQANAPEGVRISGAISLFANMMALCLAIVAFVY